MQGSEPDFSVGEWIVRPDRSCIERGAESVRIKPKSMAVLTQLAEADGGVVGRRELFDAVWPGGVVSDDVLTQCIVELRKAFGDSAKEPQVIETIPRKGFRLVPVTARFDDPRASAANDQSAQSPPRGNNGRHVATPIVVLAAVALSIVVAVLISLKMPGSGGAVETSDKSIVVLPFVDLSASGDQGYFADGLSEELIIALTNLEGLSVIGRTSSFFFKGSDEDLKSIGEQLNVGYVLEGSVRRSDTNIRVNAKLINVSSGLHLWSDTYDRPLSDIFAVQDDISQSVATALSLTLQVGQLGRMEGGTTSIEAYDAIMLGKSIHRDFDAETMPIAIQHYTRAVHIDPQFAIGWVSLANVYRDAWRIMGTADQPRYRQLAGEAAARALEIAPTSQHILAAAVYVHSDLGQWQEVEALMDVASAQSGNDDYKLSSAYIDFLLKTGRASEALELKRRASLRDPLDPGGAMYLAHLYAINGQMNNAFAELERGMSIGGFKGELSVEGLITALSVGDAALIERWLERAIDHQQPGALGVNETIADLLDDPDAALSWLRTAHAAETVPAYYTAVWASYLGDAELALDAMQRAPDPWLYWHPLAAEMRSLPGFHDLMRQTGLYDYWIDVRWGDFCRPVSGQEFECS